MSPPRSETVHMTLQSVLRRIPEYSMSIDEIQLALLMVYRRLGMHIERWYINRIIEYLNEPDVIADDTVYTRHVADTILDWIQRGQIIVDDRCRMHPLYLREVHIDTFINTEFADISNRCYIRFGHREVISALSTKFADIPSPMHIYAYIARLLSHLNDPLYVPEKNEGSDMVMNVMIEWNRAGEIDDEPL